MFACKVRVASLTVQVKALDAVGIDTTPCRQHIRQLIPTCRNARVFAHGAGSVGEDRGQEEDSQQRTWEW